jgi:hypothetical protein
LLASASSLALRASRAPRGERRVPACPTAAPLVAAFSSSLVSAARTTVVVALPSVTPNLLASAFSCTRSCASAAAFDDAGDSDWRMAGRAARAWSRQQQQRSYRALVHLLSPQKRGAKSIRVGGVRKACRRTPPDSTERAAAGG